MSRTSTRKSNFTIRNAAFALIGGALFTAAFTFESQAQTAYYEGFDEAPVVASTPNSAPTYQNELPVPGGAYTTLMPPGWLSGKYGVGTDTDNRWDRCRSTSNPTITARTGVGMARYLADYTSSGNAAFISCRQLDYRGWTVGTPTASFYMYRDNTAGTDYIQVYVSNHPDPAQATYLQLLSDVGGNSQINRYNASAPAATANTWNQYTYNIPVASIPSGSLDSVYITIIGTANLGNNILIDDFSVTHYPLQQTYSSSGLTFQNTATTAKGKSKQLIVGGVIYMDGETTAYTGNNFVFNTNGSDSPPSDICAAKLWYTGSTNTFDTLTATLVQNIANPWFTNYTFTTGVPLLHGANYFWITYDICSGAVSNHCVDAEWVSFDVQRSKAGVLGAGGVASLTLPDTVGISTGMSVSGTNVAGGALVNGFSSSTVVTLNNANTGGVNGTVIFYNTYTPSPPTLPGCRLIDLDFCIASMTAGTSWAGYTHNDYVSGVKLNGDSAANQGIYTGWQASFPLPGIQTNNFNVNGPNAGDCGASGPYPNIKCPFTTHPPDYELWAQIPKQTTSLKADGTTNYVLQAWVGTWYSSNYLAAWIDLNKDGVLNDNLLISTYSGLPGSGGVVQQIPLGTVTAGSPTINVTSLPGWGGSITVGKAIWGPGIPAGTTITGWASPTITMSQNASATATNSPLYIGFVGGEKIYQSGPLNNGANFVANFCIPSNASSGNIRFRQREVYATSSINSCQGYTWGETEDYIVTVVPPCNGSAFGAPPGYNKVWLGFTDDWDNPINWCGGIPSLSDNAFVPKFGAGGRPGDYSPVIKANVTATAGRLRIQATDSITIDAYTSSTLTIADSLIIENSSKLKVVSDLRKDAVISNGTLSLPTFFAPFRDGVKVRAFIVMRPSDFAAQGVIPGDIIDTLFFEVQRLNTAFLTAYNNVTIKYSLVTPPVSFLPGAFGSIPAYGSGPWTIFNGNIPATGLAANAFTTMTIPLTPGSFVYPNTTQWFMFEICYDNNGAAGGGTFNFKHTQIIGSNLFAIVYGTPGAAACSMIPNDPGNPATWQVNSYRPNITFRVRRPYAKYPIEARKNWVNDGSFIAGLSRVTMTGANLVGTPGINAQVISGANSTTFYDLTINNNSHVTRKTDFTVTDTLYLQNGRLKLDSGTVHLTNPALSGLRVLNGFLQSETAPAGGLFYGNFHWDMTGTSLPSSRTIPFVTNGGVYVPVTYNMTAGNHNTTFATYATSAANAPLPNHTPGPPGPVVSNVNGYATGTDNSAYMVDRYWKIYNSTPAGATADLTISWAATENAALGASPYAGQRWVANAGSTTPGAGWEFPFLAGQMPAATNVQIPGFNLFNDNIWWAVVRDINPLPVELLDFTAKPVGQRVRLDWATASELNNDKFVIERTVNMSDWSFIDELRSRGNSSITQTYQTWDENPVNGLQYYTLRQYDLGGRLTSYGPVAVDMTRKQFGIVSATVTHSTQGVSLIFNYDSNEPYTVQVVDMMGQVVAASSNNPASPGLNVMDIKANLASGIYQVILRNSTQVDTRKIFY
ncbi:MAG TPA: T9SS type A sorting domain-containing protein [Bacteroidia bacterium]|nr:T9SS type A sorting domain-containing protein [Bacteroidia bacterium]